MIGWSRRHQRRRTVTVEYRDVKHLAAEAAAGKLTVRVECRTRFACFAARVAFHASRFIVGENRALDLARRIAFRLATYRIRGGKWQRFTGCDVPTAKVVSR